MSAIGASHAVTPLRRGTGRSGRAGVVLIVITVLAAACGSGGATDVATQAPSEQQAAPAGTATKDPVDPVASLTEEAMPEATTPATEAPPSPSPEPAEPAQPPPAPAGDLVDLPSVSAAMVAAIGRTDVTTALGEIGPFPADIPFPDDAVLLEVTMSQTDARVLLDDPEAIRPISTETGGVAVTRLKIEEVQEFYLDPLAALGFELSSSGFSTTTQGDGTEVRDGFFQRGDTSAPLRENLSLTLIARADTDHVEIDLAHTSDQDGELSSPLAQWVNGLPTPEGYPLQTVRVSTFYLGSPSLGFSAGFRGPEGQVDQAIEQTMAALPAGGFELGADPTIGGEPDLRYVDLVHPQVGDGEVAVSESSGGTAIRPSIDVDFPLPASLEPFLLG